MKTIFEYLVVATIAILMVFVSYWLMELYEPNAPKFLQIKSVGWTLWTSSVSALTWIILYLMFRKIHWLAMPVMGLFSPIIGSILFFPFTPFVWFVIGQFIPVIFPVGMLTGLLISSATLPFRPRWVWTAEI